MLRPSVLSLAVAAAIATPAFSQQVGNIEQRQQTAVQLAPITVSSSREDSPLNKLANNIAVLNENTLAENFATSAEDALETLPGVSFDGNGRYGLTDVTIRGVSGNRVKILVDGQQVANTFSFGPYQTASREYMDLSNMKQVEVIKGPASSLHGSDAIGGVVSFVSKTPDDYLADGKTFGGSLFAQYSGDNRGFNFNATAAFAPSAQWDGLISLGYTNSDERKNHHGNDLMHNSRTSPNPQDVENKNVQAQLRFKPNDNHRFTLAAGLYRSDRDTDVLTASGGPASDFTYPMFGGHFNQTYQAQDLQERHSLSLRHDFDIAQSWADSGYWRAYWQRQEAEEVSALSGHYTICTGGVRPCRRPMDVPANRLRESNFKVDEQGFDLQLNKTLAGNITQNWVYGLQLNRKAVEMSRTGFDHITGRNREVLNEKNAPDSTITQIGLFAQNRLTFGDSGFSLIPGVRYDYYRLKAKPDAIFTATAGSQFAVQNLSESKLSFRLGALYDLNDNHSLYANYAEGFRAPAFNETNLGFANMQQGYSYIPNVDLKPETSRGIELGWRSDNGIFHHDLSVFYTRYKNFIASAQEVAPNPVTGLRQFQTLNTPRANIYGAELSAGIDFGGLSPNLEGFSGDISLAYAKGKNQETDEPLLDIEPLSGRLSLQYDAPSTQWGIASQLRFARGKAEKDMPSNSRSVAPGNQDTPIMPSSGYGVVDVTAYYKPIDNLSLRAGVFNLFDKEYITWSDAKQVGPINRPRSTATGRWFGASIRYDF